MLRSVNALAFGDLGDRYGRIWPSTFILFRFTIFELCSCLCQSSPQFLDIRALYGVAMVGPFGLVAATALEDLPYDARGLLRDMYQQGYAIGYLLATRGLPHPCPTTSHGWRSLSWLVAGLSVLIIAFEVCLSGRAPRLKPKSS